MLPFESITVETGTLGLDQSDRARHGCCSNMYFLFSQDLVLMLGYYVKVAVVFTWLLGGVWPMLKFYFMMRLVNK